MCGVIGIYDSEEVIAKMYSAMLTLQHRGQDSAGIVTFDGARYHMKKGNGLIRDIFDTNNVSRLTGDVAIGHTRYPTVGGGISEDAQPFWINQPFGMAGAHNGNVTNFYELKKELFEKSQKIVNSNCDGEVILHVFAEYIDRYKKKKITPQIIFGAVRHVYKKVKGSYSAVIHIAGIGMVAFRDPWGLRPLVFGQKDNKTFGFASESISLDIVGLENIVDVEHGGAVFINSEKKVYKKKVLNKPFRPCIFEYIYFARPDTVINGINVDAARVSLGRKLARKIRKENLDIDVVIPVPDSARAAAIEIARSLRVKYREGLVKNRYIGRTFIMPGNSVRKKSIREKLNPIVDVIKDKSVLIVDDSIVRGNTSKSIVEMVRETGAKKVYFASYSAPLVEPCVYGIDMQTRGEFIAVDATDKEVAEKLGADAVIYQNVADMELAVREQNMKIKSFCKACFNGIYPTKDVSDETLESIEEERLDISRKNENE